MPSMQTLWRRRSWRGRCPWRRWVGGGMLACLCLQSAPQHGSCSRRCGGVGGGVPFVRVWEWVGGGLCVRVRVWAGVGVGDWPDCFRGRLLLCCIASHCKALLPPSCLAPPLCAVLVQPAEAAVPPHDHSHGGHGCIPAAGGHCEQGAPLRGRERALAHQLGVCSAGWLAEQNGWNVLHSAAGVGRQRRPAGCGRTRSMRLVCLNNHRPATSWKPNPHRACWAPLLPAPPPQNSIMFYVPLLFNSLGSSRWRGAPGGRAQFQLQRPLGTRSAPRQLRRCSGAALGWAAGPLAIRGNDGVPYWLLRAVPPGADSLPLACPPGRPRAVPAAGPPPSSRPSWLLP